MFATSYFRDLINDESLDQPSATTILSPNELLELEEICKGFSYKLSVKMVDLNLKLLSMSLTRGEARTIKDHSNHVRGRLFYPSETPLLLRKSRLGRLIWTSRCVGPISRLFLAYFMVKFALITYHKFQLGSYLKTWDPQVRQANVSFGAGGGGKFGLTRCARTGDLVRVERDAMVMRQLEHHRAMLDLLGDPYASIASSPLLLYLFYLSSLLFIYGLNFIVLDLHRIRLDSIGFLLRPKAHLNRMLAERRHLITDLLRSFCRFARARREHDRCKYVELLVAIGQLHLMRPANLGARWHRFAASFMGRALAYYIIFTIYLILSNVLLLACIELFMRANQRAKEFRCQAQGLVLVRPHIGLAPLNEEDAKLYQELEANQIFTLVYLGLAVEYRYFFGWAQLSSLLEISILTVYCSAWFSFLLFVYTFSIVDRLIWLKQVGRQLERGFAAVSKLKLRANDDESLNQALESLTGSHLNYSLFISTYGTFKSSLHRFVVDPLVSVSISMFLGSYLIALNTEHSGLMAQVVLCGQTCLLMMLNIFLAGPAAILSQVQRHMKLVCAIVANIPEDSHVGLKFLKQRWSQQLINDKSLTLMVATSLFGNSMTTRRLVTMNSYLTAVWLVLYKSI